MYKCPYLKVFLQAGASVTISDMNEEVGLRSVGELRKQFGKDRVNFVVCNVTKGNQSIYASGFNHP